MPKKDLRKQTPKQMKLIKLLLENLGTPNNTKSLNKLLLEAGYSQNQADNPYQILESETIKEGLKGFLDQLDDKRRLAITSITKKKLEKSPARDDAYILDILTKNHQLLGGGATERIQITEDEKKAVDDAFNNNS